MLGSVPESLGETTTYTFDSNSVLVIVFPLTVVTLLSSSFLTYAGVVFGVHSVYGYVTGIFYGFSVGDTFCVLAPRHMRLKNRGTLFHTIFGPHFQ